MTIITIELDKPHVECFAELGDVPVKYKFKRGMQDRQHLLIIFSGFGWPKPVTYDFDGQALSNCRSNVLWIKDEFWDECTYYLCHRMDFSIEHAVISLIDSILNTLGLSRMQCTLLGGSKGGSAALYYGLKYDFKNIISSCPQFKVGSYALTGWPASAEHMQGSISQQNTDYLDSLIPELLYHDQQINRNIYLISSPDDEQYEHEIKPFMSLFTKYTNFNFIFTRSALAWQHNKIYRYNIPIILSIIYAHGEGIYPRFGRVSNGVPASGWDSSPRLAVQRQKKRPVGKLNKARIEGDIFFPEGVAFIRGYPCTEHGALTRALLLQGDKRNYSFNLGSVKNKEFSYEFCEDVYCDYSAAGFASINHSGFDLSHLPYGKYQLGININLDGEDLNANLFAKKLDVKSINGAHEYRIHSDGENTWIIKRNILEAPQSGIFRLENSWRKENLIHYEGVFIIPGIEVKEWGDVKFYLVLHSNKNTFSFNLGMSHRPALNKELGGYSVYQKSYFATPGYKGIDISELPVGGYDVYVAMSYQSSLFINRIENSLYLDAPETN